MRLAVTLASAGARRVEVVAVAALLVVAAVALISWHTPGSATGGPKAVVPAGSASVLIRSTAAEARPDDRPRQTSDRLTYGYATLVDVLNAGVGTSGRVLCDFAGLARSYSLVFDYPDRAGITVTIAPDCHPSVDWGNGVHTDNLGPVLAIVRHLIGLPPGLR